MRKILFDLLYIIGLWVLLALVAGVVTRVTVEIFKVGWSIALAHK